MKTLTKTLFATLLAAVVLTSTAMTTLAANTVKVASVKNSFNKIWVSGNVKIELTQSDTEGVFVAEGFDAEKTSVMSKGQTLYINSMESGQVTIKVSVKDLQRIEAAGNAVVVMSNSFNVKYLQLFLSQSAKAKINAVAGSMYTVVNDDAVLNISGITHDHTLLASNIANVKSENFRSINTNSQGTELAMKTALLTAK
ncbi:MAG TPA: DUF2807 domain-containing protein [Pedobacter sp.]|nr:DUF2807 domain-containing protein [Pedobacter sp.]